MSIKNITIVILLFLSKINIVQAADSLTVYVFLSETCPICQNQTQHLKELDKQFSNKNVTFVGVFPNQQFSTEETISRFAKKYKIDFLLKKDENQILTQRLRATITPQAIVYDESEKKILYSGLINNGFERIGRRRQVITEFQLRDALTQITEGKKITQPETKPVGCFIVKM